jgi:glycogen debranching enzyme
MAEPVDRFYIVAPARPPDERRSVLKHGDTFGVFDRFGDVYADGGLFFEDTRYLSSLRLLVEGREPLLLSSMVQDNNAVLTVDLTNPDMMLPSGIFLPHGALHLVRSKFIWDSVCYERLRLRAYIGELLPLTVQVDIDGDFADIFEVRGAKRTRHGTCYAPKAEADGLAFVYDGLDRKRRTLRVGYAPAPSRQVAGHLEFELSLAPGREERLFLTYACEAELPVRALPAGRAAYDQATTELGAMLEEGRARQCDITTSNAQFNAWLERSSADLRMMLSNTKAGAYPYAGVPWYSTPFGRDGIISALEVLWRDPSIARGVLLFLARTQAQARDPDAAAEPGKVLHEMRRGEMAALGEVPFGCYYGTVDATPLYLMLAGAYYGATADAALIEEIWPSIEAALRWVDESGDLDHDGFVEYATDVRGLRNQGWKDSADAVFHADGSYAEGPIALCEVQSYVFAAKLAVAALAEMRGERGRADELRRQALLLQERFEEAFWCEEIDTYAIALDGSKRPCRVRTSNAGQCLLSRIVRPERARRTALTLLGEESFSGWGIRTVAVNEARYNPMSYHNGSVWPHDNAMVALGLARYGYKSMALDVMMGLFDASLSLDNHRLPELFCGFPRRRGQGPTLYPVACSPQAWASGAVFMLLSACLGMSIDAPNGRVEFFHPVLPPFLQELRISNLRVGAGAVDLTVHRYPDDVGINVVRRRGVVEVVNIK